jgi:uracil-DNA glycosylase
VASSDLEDSVEGRVVDVHPSYRMNLAALEQEWSACQSCELGVSRHQVGGAFVFGEGMYDTGGVMFVGEGPGKDEEIQGRPFIGASGQFLRGMLEELKFDNCYITNTVCCRSWDYAYDTQGNRLIRKNYRTKQDEYVVKDETPKPAQMVACAPRLLQQIYLVDPALIITLGGSAAESLLGKSVKIQAQNGQLDHVSIPGAGAIPQLTPKGAWARKTGPKGARLLIAPTIQNRVTYPVIPLVHPAYAMANKQDERPGSPMNLFVTGLQKARNIYAAYVHEMQGGQRAHYEVEEGAVARALDEEIHGSNFD